MFKLPNIFAVTLLGAALVAGSAQAQDSKYNFGAPASAEEIAGWDIDIRPDGMGLPVGSGNAMDGEEEYEVQCAACHGVFGEGEGRWPVLVGGEGTLADERPVKTVGSYWPYASTLFDYIRRSMPFPAPMSLSDQQVYDITAYVLYMNEIIEEDFELSNENLAGVKMPNEANFFVDDRPDVQNPRCMADCADPSTMMLASSLAGVTPIGHFVDGADAPAASHEGQHDLEAQKEADRKADITGEEVVASHAAEPAAMSAQAQAGEAVYKGACFVCHDSGLAGAPKVGDAAIWTERVGQGMDLLVSHALHGYSGSAGVMPPKGGRMDLSDEAVTDAVYFMVESSH
ncbi:MAG TPA: cytochrome C [Oceanospirillaceae bacterium]|nr:cytochrome C [Oceanospirillaceae bacterium]